MKGKQLGSLILILAIIAGMFTYTFVGFESVGGPRALAKDMKLGLDIEGGVFVVYDVETTAKDEELKQLINQTITVLTRRIDALGLTEPNIYAEGKKRIRVELPGVKDSEGALKLIGTTAQLKFAQIKDNETAVSGEKFDEKKMKFLFLGDGVDQASPARDHLNNFIISLKLKPEATKIFADATSESLNFKNKNPQIKSGQIAILLDEVVISAPSVSAAILDGEATITGNFTSKEAEDLAFLIRSGALPVKLIEERSSIKGPTLGRDALNKSVTAAIIGVILVMLFMIVFYKMLGVIASISLVLYTSIIVVLMVFMNATLTLPGVLGIVLSIGMAVDANVIIYEKIKEELAASKSLRAAVNHGFSKAFSAIIDSNVTTLIAAAVLFNLGDGPIKGFAVTLMLGIITSMFTAIFITKALIKNIIHIKAFSKKSLYSGLIMPQFKFDFYSRKKLWFGISGLLIAIGIGFAAISNFNFGIDFTGGTMIQVQMHEKLNSDQINAAFEGTDYKFEINFEGKNLNQAVLKTSDSLNQEKRNEVFNILSKKFNLKTEDLLMSDQFGPKVGSETQTKSLNAIIIAALGMLVYITIRFEFKFAVSAILALLHDILILFAVYAVFRIPVSSAFIAALLTVVGYSINDTIVIFDRIRDELSFTKSADEDKLVNYSLNHTLMRSINTSVTTLIVILSLLIFGVSAIRELSIPLLAGVLAGTYSSVFIASLLWCQLRKIMPGKKTV